MSRQELRAIWDRNESEDVRRLLWEIRALRGTVSRADQLAQSIGPNQLGGALARILELLRIELAKEPVVHEKRAMEAECDAALAAVGPKPRGLRDR